MTGEKLRILVFNANKGGCAYYRALMPFAKLAEKFPDNVEVRFDENPLGLRCTAEEIKEARIKYLNSIGKQYSDDLPPETYADAPDSFLMWREGHNFKNMKWADVIVVNNISNFGGQYMTRVVGKAHDFGDSIFIIHYFCFIFSW